MAAKYLKNKYTKSPYLFQNMEADKVLSIEFCQTNVSLRPKVDTHSKNWFDRPLDLMNKDEKNPLRNSKSNLTKY